MRTRHAQSGWTTYGVLGTIVSAAIGALGFEALLRLIPDGAAVAVPWVLVSIFLLPLTICIQLLLKLFDLKEQLDDMSRNERRRLRTIIEGKARQLIIAAVYYVVSAVIVASLLFFSGKNMDFLKVSIVITGGLLGVSVFSISLLLSELKELSDFKAKIKERSEARKKQRAAFKRLHPK